MAKPKVKSENTTEPEDNLPVVQQQGGALAAKGAVTAEMLLEDENAGNSEVKSEDVAMPYLYILQDGSPQVKQRHEAYIEGAKAGDIYNNVTREVFDGERGLLVVNVFYHRRYTEWTPRDNGGGMVKDYGTDGSIVAKCKEVMRGSGKDQRKVLETPDGNDMVESGAHYVMYQHPDTGIWNRGILSMASTQLKTSRRWNSIIAEIQVPKPGGGSFSPARFYTMFRVTSAPDSNKKGDWMAWQVARVGNTVEHEPGGDALYLSAREFAKLVKEGSIKVAPPPDEFRGGSPADGKPLTDAEDDGPIPF